MTETHTLTAEPRLRAGKGTARQTRRAGRIPAVIYGNKETPLMISLDLNEFGKILKKPGFFTHLFDVTVAGAVHRVLPRDVQFHPVSDLPEHVDFLRVSAETKITVHVPVRFVGQDKSPGLKRGGTLNVVLHEIELSCDAANIPEHIDISLEGLDLGAFGGLDDDASSNAEAVGAAHLGDVIGHLVRGDFFGERALLRDDRRAASIVADTPVVRVLIIKKRLFGVLSNALVGGATASIRRYGHIDPEVVSLTRHIHRFRRLVMGRDLPASIAERTTLMRLMAAFSPELSVEDVLGRLVAVMYDLFACERVSVFLVDRASDPERPQLVIKVSQDMNGKAMPLTGIAGACVTGAELINVPDAYADPRFNPANDRATGFRTESMLAVPIMDPPHSGIVTAVSATSASIPASAPPSSSWKRLRSKVRPRSQAAAAPGEGSPSCSSWRW